MQEHDTFPGKVYAVTSASGCTITDNKGRTLGECEAGKQTLVVATSDKLITSADALVTATFNFAPAKLRALGLLGGGVQSDGLPSGYLAAEFMQNSELGWVDTGLKAHGDTAVECEFVPTQYNWINYYYLTGSQNTLPAFSGSYDYNKAYGRRFTYGYGSTQILRLDGQGGKPGYSSTLGQKYTTKQDGGAFYIDGQLIYELPEEDFESSEKLCFYGGLRNGNAGVKNLQMYRVKVSRAGVKHGDYVPCIDQTGVPCFYDRVTKKTFYFKPYTAGAVLIAGMTCKQARKLGELPAGGGALTVSLPSNYLEDEGVANAIAEANAKDWNIEVASTWDASAASATFALRRIWVRKTQDEQGNYIAADGTRWEVESCVAMYNADGSEPDAHGYEPFRSVEAAVAYWELVPYVTPEELTDI